MIQINSETVKKNCMNLLKWDLKIVYEIIWKLFNYAKAFSTNFSIKVSEI